MRALRAARRFLTGALVVVCSAGPAWPAEPTSPATKAEMIRLIDALEKHPNDPSAGDARTKVMAWLTEAPDVTVIVCGELLGGIKKFKNKEQGDDMLTALMFGEARFTLENPNLANDDQSIHMAGVESALRTYAAMKADDPKLDIAPMETLARMQREEKLSEFVLKAITVCN